MASGLDLCAACALDLGFELVLSNHAPRPDKVPLPLGLVAVLGLDATFDDKGRAWLTREQHRQMVLGNDDEVREFCGFEEVLALECGGSSRPRGLASSSESSDCDE